MAAPSVPVEGRIVDDATSDPLSGFLVSAGSPMAHISTVTDKNGRYSLTGLAKSDDSRLIVVPPRGSRYLPIGVSPKTKDARDTVKLDMKLKPVALLRGQVKDSATGKPISGSIQYNAMAKNPNLADYRGFTACDLHECKTDNDGRYEIAVLPGEGVVTFRADESLRYRRVAKSKSKIGDRFTTFEEMGIYEAVPHQVYPKDYQFLKQLLIEKVDTDLELSIELSSGVSLDVRVVKSNGEPAPNAILNGVAEFSGWDSIRDGGLKIEGYYADQGRELFAYDPESHQAAHVQLTGSQTGEVAVTLQPSPIPQAVLKGFSERSGWYPVRDGALKIDGNYADQGRELFAYDPESHQAAHVQLTGPQTGEIEVTLQPAGTLRGRLVDKQGVAASSV
ncbi:MAG TPA: hypothetical protein VM260_18600, partial [Pirellula sp.]|nr:hypothetical protein [Pirellula sp.]